MMMCPQDGCDHGRHIRVKQSAKDTDGSIQKLIVVQSLCTIMHGSVCVYLKIFWVVVCYALFSYSKLLKLQCNFHDGSEM